LSIDKGKSIMIVRTLANQNSFSIPILPTFSYNGLNEFLEGYLEQNNANAVVIAFLVELIEVVFVLKVLTQSRR